MPATVSRAVIDGRSVFPYQRVSLSSITVTVEIGITSCQEAIARQHVWTVSFPSRYLCFFFGVIWVLKPSSPKCTLKLAKQEYKSTLTTSIGIRIMFLWLAAGLSKSIDIDW